MALQNLPRITVDKIDQSLGDEPITRAPRIMVVGTAGQGAGHQVYSVSTTTLAKAEFGSEGTLLRGMWEVSKSGAEEIRLYRIGSTPAVLDNVGGGYTITTIMEDDVAGASYEMYYDDSENRLVVRRTADEIVVYDNSLSAPIELFEVTVSGTRASGTNDDIGSSSSWVALEDVTSLSSPPTGVTYVAGTDGLSMSRMEMYQELYVAYQDLLSSNFDVLVPMDVYLDDYNVVDQGHYLGAVTPVLPDTNTFPTANSNNPGVDVDSLGKVYVEEYEGRFYFWWDINGDGTAELFPTDPTGAARDMSTLKIDGTTLIASDFHEVNFAYQMARFLHDMSTDIVDSTGVIGVLPPASTGLVDRARWLGKAPDWTLNTTTGEYTIESSADNGTGLLGNKFMVGRDDHRAGVFGGGFILTDGMFMDSGDEVVDANNAPVDLGRYISVVADTVFMRNNYYPAGYLATFAPSYGGFYIGRAPQSAPTNKVVSSSIRLIYRQALPKLDSLAGSGYVVLRNKEKGLVVADAPTAATPNSDWVRLSTVRIVKAVVDAVRRVSDPYLGEGLSPSSKEAMKEDIEQVLLSGKQDKYLVNYKEFTIEQTPSMGVAGRANVSLVLQPAFELRHLAVTVALSKSI